MLEGLKKLFSYRKPMEPELGFELLEGPDESKSWNSYQENKNFQDGPSAGDSRNDAEGDERHNSPRKMDGEADKTSHSDQCEGQQSTTQSQDKVDQQAQKGMNRNHQSENQSDEQETQLQVYENLMSIMKNSQRDNHEESPVVQWDQQKNHQQLQAAFQGLTTNKEGEAASQQEGASNQGDETSNQGDETVSHEDGNQIEEADKNETSQNGGVEKNDDKQAEPEKKNEKPTENEMDEEGEKNDKNIKDDKSDEHDVKEKAENDEMLVKGLKIIKPISIRELIKDNRQEGDRSQASVQSTERNFKQNRIPVMEFGEELKPEMPQKQGKGEDNAQTEELKQEQHEQSEVKVQKKGLNQKQEKQEQENQKQENQEQENQKQENQEKKAENKEHLAVKEKAEKKGKEEKREKKLEREDKQERGKAQGQAKENDKKPGHEKEKNREGQGEASSGKASPKKKDRNEKSNDSDNKENEEVTVEPLTWVDQSLEKNIKFLEMTFHIPLNKDVIIRKFKIGRQIPACVIFVDGMVEKEIIVQFTLPQLMDAHPFVDFQGGCPLDYIEQNVLSIHQIERMDKFSGIIPQILSGLVVVFVDGCKECLVMESRGFEKRSVGTPVTETVVHGAQEGFTENLRTNITLIRRIVKNENLITEFFTVSKTNNYTIGMLYLMDVVNQDLLNEVKRRISSLEIDYIAGNGMLEQLIEDKNMMLFPQVISTERPDRVASFLMEGKVVLVCEGTPFAIAMPITFFDLYHTSEETNLRWYYGSFLRIIRLMGILLATFLPGAYTALTLFHQEMIPTSLLSSIVVSRSAVPFPTILEILLMELSFELIREGGIRVPGVIGNTLGIIGALILGQAAVEAGLVSPILIIIVAVAGLGSFAIPNYSLSLAIRIIRFLLIFFGCIAGFYGISSCFTVICALALGMKSFGVPFFSPVAPTTRSNKDNIIRGPLAGQKQRTDFLNPKNEKRMAGHPRGWEAAGEGGHAGDQGR